MKYCMGCMENIEDEVLQCPSCGFMQNNQNVQGLLQTGTILQNRYIVGRSIGNGGFGVTYIGLDAQLKRKIAIKEFFPRKTSVRMKDGLHVVAPSMECQQAFNRGLEQFLNEAKHLARLSHIQGIVYIYNFFQENGTGYIIMEYLEGKDLRNLLHQHNEKLPFDEADMSDTIVDTTMDSIFGSLNWNLSMKSAMQTIDDDLGGFLTLV